jgi:nucleoside-diphosphate kinase
VIRPGRPDQRGGVLSGVDWTRWSVVLLKPDCVREGLVDAVLARIAEHADIVHCEQQEVVDWQVFVHYWDLLVDADWLDLDVAEALRSAYVGHQVVVALARGTEGVDTPARLRALLGGNDPSSAQPGTIRADLGRDSMARARAEGRLLENLVHTSDNAEACSRDFGTWFGASRASLLTLFDPTPPLPGPRRVQAQRRRG